MTEIARHFGRDQSNISRAVRRAEEQAARNNAFEARLRELKNALTHA